MSIVKAFRLSEDRTQLDLNIEASAGLHLLDMQLYHHDDPGHMHVVRFGKTPFLSFNDDTPGYISADGVIKPGDGNFVTRNVDVYGFTNRLILHYKGYAAADQVISCRDYNLSIMVDIPLNAEANDVYLVLPAGTNNILVSYWSEMAFELSIVESVDSYGATISPDVEGSTTPLGLLYGVIREITDDSVVTTRLLADHVLRPAIFRWTLQTVMEIFSDNDALDEIYADQRNDMLLYESLGKALDTCIGLNDVVNANLVYDLLNEKFGAL